MTPLIFLAALIVGWLRFRILRSAWLRRLARRQSDRWLLALAALRGFDALFFTKRGRLRRRRDIERDVLDSFGAYMFATVRAQAWVRRRP